MKQIRAIPKLVFDKHFTDKEFKYYDYACFISILDIDNNEQKFADVVYYVMSHCFSILSSVEHLICPLYL